MNVFKKIHFRLFQFCCRVAIPILPYREPCKLSDYDDIADIIQKKNLHCAFVVTDKTLHELGICDQLLVTLEKRKISYAIYDGTVANPTTDNVAEAVKTYLDNGCDCLVAFGGGSSMDCAKAVGAQLTRPNKTIAQMKGLMKVRKRIPTLFAIPTTAGTGSETTVAAVITDSETRHKYAISDFCLIPDYVLFDSTLTVGLPPFVTATTGMDALTHAVEAYVGRSTTKDSRRNALNAAKIIFENIETVVNDGHNQGARGKMLYASYLAGLAFTKSYVGYVHAIAHALGGKYNVAHGLANAVILPYILEYYGNSVYRKLWKIGVYANLFDKYVSKAEGARIVIDRIKQLNTEMNIPTTLDCIRVEDVPELARTAEKEANPLYPVPKLLTAKQLEQVFYNVAGIEKS